MASVPAFLLLSQTNRLSVAGVGGGYPPGPSNDEMLAIMQSVLVAMFAGVVAFGIIAGLLSKVLS